MTISEFKCRNEGCLKIKYDKNEFFFVEHFWDEEMLGINLIC